MSEMLVSLYKKFKQAGHSEIGEIASSFYPPLLISPPDDWYSSINRIAFIGQETLGWQWTKNDSKLNSYEWDRPDLHSLSDFFASPTSVTDLSDGYRLFDFAARQPKNFNSPFWRFFRKTKAAVSQRGETASAIFSNVIRCAAKTETGFTLWSLPESSRKTYLSWQQGLLKAELEILQPTLIIFVTGPYYDHFILREFDGVAYEPVDDLAPRLLSKISSKSINASAYRTYHPNYLNRGTGFAPIDAAIADAKKLIR